MKIRVLNNLLTLALFATGCAFNQEVVITQPVGPPVIIVTGKITSVHSDSSGCSLAKQYSEGNLVTLPDGQIMGWLADGSSNPDRNP